MAKFTGSGRLKVNGELYKTVPDSIELNFGGAERKTQMADGGFNYSETPVAATVKAKFLHTPKTKVKTLNELEEGLIEVIFDTGSTYEITEAARMGAPLGLATSDGQLTGEFAGTMILKQ